MTRIDAQALAALNADYVRCIDDDRLEGWPEFFFAKCVYRITTAENHKRGYEAGLIYADSRGMLEDRIASLRRANVFERHTYRHVVGAPAILGHDGNAVTAESTFIVVRIMRDGSLGVFATGRYFDRVESDADGRLKFRERVVVCDNSSVDTLLVIPL